MVGATESGVCFIGFAEDFDALEGDLRQRFPKARVEPAPAALAETVRQVVGSWRSRRPRWPCRSTCAAPPSSGGSGRRWWRSPSARPGPMARWRAIGAPKAVRAVARACAQNHVSLAVPCHRVVGKDGDLTGYRWGVPRKRALLAKEKAGAGG